jgi:hypothetical protein
MKHSRVICLISGLFALNFGTSLAQDLVSPQPRAPIFNPSVPFSLPQPPEIPVSPVMPSTMGATSIGATATNPFTGLMCSAEGSLAVGTTGPIPGTIPLPEPGEPSEQMQAPASVFGTQGAPGPC